jgi:hypothetical protein
LEAFVGTVPTGDAVHRYSPTSCKRAATASPPYCDRRSRKRTARDELALKHEIPITISSTHQSGYYGDIYGHEPEAGRFD